MIDALKTFIQDNPDTYPMAFCLAILSLLMTVILLSIPLMNWKDQWLERRARKQADAESAAAMERMRQHFAKENKRYQADRVIAEQEHRAAETAQEARRAQLGLMSLDEIWRLTGTQFEEAIAYTLPFWGYSNVRRVGGSNDRGVDVVGVDREGRKVIVQCKQYASGKKVTSPEIQTFNGAIHGQGASYGIFITTSDYTPQARSLAKDYGIKILDGPSLNGCVRRYHFNA